MCKIGCDCFDDYDVDIESDLYDKDYDDVYTNEEEETREETDIQFE